jgi:hypothetical protein
MAIEERVEIKIFYAHCLERKAFGPWLSFLSWKRKYDTGKLVFPAGDTRPK